MDGNEQLCRRALMLSNLTASMCHAQGPTEALVTAIRACTEEISSVVFAGLAVMANDRQTIQYHTLHSAKAAAERLGILAPSTAAAAIAIETKQAVNVRDISNGDLGLHDLQYLQEEHSARSYFAAPLVVAETAMAVLCLAADQPSAFAGHEDWLIVVAAMCAPYVALLRSHQQLVAMESFVTQVMPVRAALQLRGAATQASRSSMEGSFHQQELLQQPAAVSSDPGASSSTAAAARTTTNHGAAGQQQQQQLSSFTPQVDMQQQLDLRSLSTFMTFKQPQLELAYRIAVCRQWQQRLDGLFLLLTLLAAVGGHLVSGLSGNLVINCIAGLVMLLAVVGLVQQLQAQPPHRYVAWRQPIIAAVQLLQVAMLCWKQLLLPASSFSRPAVAVGAGSTTSAPPLVRALGWNHAEVAACGVLLMQGLTGLLHPPLHAAVQLVCASVTVSTTWLLEKGGMDVAIPIWSRVLLLLVAWGVPVAVAAVVDWHCRVAFIQKLR